MLTVVSVTVPCVVIICMYDLYKQDESNAVQQLAALMHKAKAHTDDVRAELEVRTSTA
jgi:predicted transcriptional regulator